MSSQFQLISPSQLSQIQLHLNYVSCPVRSFYLKQYGLSAKQIDRAVYYFLESDLAFLLWIRDLVLRILACLMGI